MRANIIPVWQLCGQSGSVALPVLGLDDAAKRDLLAAVPRVPASSFLGGRRAPRRRQHLRRLAMRELAKTYRARPTTDCLPPAPHYPWRRDPG